MYIDHMTKTVIHFGSSLTRFIIDHNIDSKLWTQIFNQSKELRIWNDKKLNQKYKIYQYDNFIYEYNQQEEKCVCYSNKYNNLQMLKLIGSEPPFQTALTYTSDKTIFSELDFQPINKYYNVHEIERHEFSNQFMMLRFEKKDNSHEIMAVLNDNSWDNCEQLLKSFINFTGMQFSDC